MSDAEDEIIQRYHKAKRNLDLVTGLAFLVSLIVCPTLYFVFGRLVFILFLPVIFLASIELMATCALMYLKKKAVKKIENQRAAEFASMSPEEIAIRQQQQQEARKLPKKISGIVTIPQHQQALQLQMAHMHHTYGPPQYETLQPPPYQVVILQSNQLPNVHQQSTLRY